MRRLPLLFLFFLAALLTGLLIGPTAIAPGQIVAALFHPSSSVVSAIVWQIRLPRILGGALVGASLGLAGLVFQALLRNPLADP